MYALLFNLKWTSNVSENKSNTSNKNGTQELLI